MQKISKKASILIWSIFFSLIISISFLNISTKITKNLKNNNSHNINILEESNINNTLKTSENNIEIIWKNIIYIENSTLKKSLKSMEKYVIDFPINSNIDLNLTSSWVVFYNFIWTVPSSGILNNNNPNLTNYETWVWILELTNLSWYINFKLDSDNKFEISEKKYKIIENIWNKNVIKSRGIIK